MKKTHGFLAENRYDIGIKFILFLLSPLLGFIYSLKRINTKSSFIIFFLFSLCFGMCFTPEKSPIYLDGTHYQELFENSINITTSTFIDNFIEYTSLDTYYRKDLYADVLSFCVSRISNNYHLFFFFASLIFSFFSLKTFKYLTKEKEFDNSYVCLLLCFLFVYITIFNINGLRFWTGYWIAMLALFKIFRDRNYKYIILLIVAALCHGTLWFLLPLVLLALFTYKCTSIWIVLYIASFFIGEASILFTQNIADYLPMFMQDFVNSYTSAEAINRITADGTGFWFVDRLFGYIVDIFFFVTMMLIISNRKHVINDVRTKKIFALLMVLITFSNFTSSVPSLGSRFEAFSYPLIAYIWLLCIKNYKQKYSIFFMLIPAYFFMDIFYTLRFYVYTLNIDFYFSSPVYLSLKYLLL